MISPAGCSAATPRSVDWVGGLDGRLELLDQTRLPTEIEVLTCDDVETVWEAIKMLRVRGAPALGVAAALGLVVGSRDYAGDEEGFFSRLREVAAHLRTSRPTAVNLFWALRRMEAHANHLRGRPLVQLKEDLLEEALRIRDEDRASCAAIGRYGAELLRDGWGVLTHCNAGALATADYGTALSVLFHAHAAGKRIIAYADETRPLLQGSRLTAWELLQRGIPTVLLCDNMAAVVMREQKINTVIVGADRIAANGDTANKIGTYGVAVLACWHGIPFYVAAPTSTFDFALASGERIPIEFRDPREVTHGMGRQTAPEGVKVFNPAFDVTPAKLVTAFITEKGVIRPPYAQTLQRTLLPAGPACPSLRLVLPPQDFLTED